MDKRERIFQATEELLAEKGFHSLSMSMVAKHANVATGTIYRYFTDKNDLLRQLYIHVNAQALEALYVDHDPQLTPFEQYRRFWLNAYRLITEDADCLCCKSQYEASPHYEEIERDPQIQAMWQPLYDFFEHGRQQGLFIDLPSRVLCTLSLDSVVHIAQLIRLMDEPLDVSQIDSVILASWRAVLQPTTPSQE